MASDPKAKLIRETAPMSARSPRLKARVAVANDAGAILCVLHAKPNQEPFWCLPGGNVDGGESLAEAAARELREEVGVEVELDTAILLVDGPDVDAVEVIFRGRIRAGIVELGADSGDPYLAEAAWCAPGDLPASFRPARLAGLLQRAPLGDLPGIDVSAWGD